MVSRQPAVETSASGAISPRVPALFTAMSRPPKRSCAVSASLRARSSSRTSPATAAACPPAARVDDHGGALRGEEESGGASDAGAGAGDDGGLAGEAGHGGGSFQKGWKAPRLAAAAVPATPLVAADVRAVPPQASE